MKTTGLVFCGKRYWSPYGSTAPANSLPDVSRYGNDGTFTNTPVWTQLPSGIWTIAFTAASSQLITIGDIGVAKTICFWLKPDTTTESIIEELAATGISCNAGSMVYGSWDDCFINGTNTDTITTNWQHIAITSTTYVTMSAFRLGLVNVTYYDGSISLPVVYWDEFSQDEINRNYESERHLFGV